MRARTSSVLMVAALTCARASLAAECDVQLLDAGIGEFRGTVEARLFNIGRIKRVSYDTAKSKRPATEVYFAPACRPVAQEIASALHLPAAAAQPLTWKA